MLVRINFYINIFISFFCFILYAYFRSKGIEVEVEGKKRVLPNTGKYGAEITPHLDDFHAVGCSQKVGRLRQEKRI